MSDSNVKLYVLEVMLPSTKPIVIINTYRPPSSNVGKMIEQLQVVLDSIDQSTEIFILGDLNIDLSHNTPCVKK